MNLWYLFEADLNFGSIFQIKHINMEENVSKYVGSNGYTYKIIIYEGKQSKPGEALSETIITSLCENYLNS